MPRKLLDRLASFIMDREPIRAATGLAGVITAVFGVLAAAGLDIAPELVAAIAVLATALAGWAARKRAWSPASHQAALNDKETHP